MSFRRVARRLVLKVLPPLVLERLGRTAERAIPTRKDPRWRDVQPDVRLLVCWKLEHPSIGRGPCAALYVHDQQVVRFDCFGPEQGHFHVLAVPRRRDGRRVRYMLPEHTVEGQIERAAFELRHNAEAWLALDTTPAVRDLRLDQRSVEAAVEWMVTEMLTLWRTIPELAAEGSDKGDAAPVVRRLERSS